MGALLDTHTLYWLVSDARSLAPEALLAIIEQQSRRELIISAMSAWELGVAAQKSPRADRPDLGRHSARQWLRNAQRATGARVAPITQRIALEAAEVTIQTGHKDPGDCFLIATARVKDVPLITRDGKIHQIAREQPGYLTTIDC